MRRIGWRRHGLAAVLAAFGQGAAAEWLVDASAGLGHDDNLPRAQRDIDIESDTVLGAQLSAAWRSQLTTHLALTLGATVEADAYTTFGELDRLALRPEAALHAKLGLGRLAPRAYVAVDAGRLDYRNRQRDGWEYRLTTGIAKRFGDRWDLRADYRLTSRRSDEVVDIPALVQRFGIPGDAFDTDSHSFGVGVTFTVSRDLSLVVDYARQRGDVTSTTRPEPRVFVASDAITPDSVFGPGRFAYRVNADTDVLGIGASYALDRRASLEVSYSRIESRADAGFSYLVDFLGASVHVAF